MHVILGAIALALLAACARDRESVLRTRLDQWFFLGKTVYFDSRLRCTGAMIQVSVGRPRHELPVHASLARAKDALGSEGVAAIRVEAMTPTGLADALLLDGTGVFGRQTLAAAALAGPCFEDAKISGFLFEALNRPGATLAYDAQSGGMMILDPDRNRLFFVASDVW